MLNTTLGAQLVWERWGGGGFPCPFLKIEKKCPDFGIKGPNYVHPWVKSSIQNVVLRVSRRKSSEIFPCELFFLALLTKGLSKCPNSTKPPLPLKISDCAPVLRPHLTRIAICEKISLVIIDTLLLAVVSIAC